MVFVLLFQKNLYMKKTLLVLLIFLPFALMAQDIEIPSATEATTIYLIRHCEKDRSDVSNKNPELTRKGYFRAESWAKVFSKVDLDAVYSTNYNRTLMTASPTASSKELQIQMYNPDELFSDQFKEETAGKTVLVVGHSNTTPAFVNAIIGEDKFPDMSDNDNSSLYVVTIYGEQKSVQILSIN